MKREVSVLPASPWPLFPVWTLLKSREEFGGDLPLLSVSAEFGVRERLQGEGRAAADDTGGYRVVRPGDLVVNRLSARDGAYAVSKVEGLVSPAYWVFRGSRTDFDSRWIDYVMRSAPYEAELRRISKFMPPAQFDLPWDCFRRVLIPLPPFAIQRAIADYLDRETARIAALIAAKRHMVELLEERWATIRWRLTRVGESPISSRFIQLKRVARLQAGAAFPHNYQGNPNGTIPYVKVGDLANVDKHDRLQGVSNRVTPEVAKTLRSPVLPRGTIVLPKIGAALLTNRRAVLSEPSCLDQNVMGVTVQSGEPRFVYHCLASIDLGKLSTPGPVPLLNEQAALSVRIPWPSAGDQKMAVKALEAQRNKAIAPAADIATQGKLLQWRRQALVTAAVTGQLDIPEVA